MAISTRRAHQLAEDGELADDEVLKTLYESEGVQGCRLVPGIGHPLQHIAVLLTPGMPRKSKASQTGRAMLDEARTQFGITPLERQYWQRGPGNSRIRHHSMFQTDEEAACLIREALCGEGGVQALRYVALTDEVTVCLATYLGLPYHMIRRVGDQNDEWRFTMARQTTTLVVVVLHSRYGTLHIHTAFPTQGRGHQDEGVGGLTPTMRWELEVTDRVTDPRGDNPKLIRANLPAGTAWMYTR